MKEKRSGQDREVAGDVTDILMEMMRRQYTTAIERSSADENGFAEIGNREDEQQEGTRQSQQGQQAQQGQQQGQQRKNVRPGTNEDFSQGDEKPGEGFQGEREGKQGGRQEEPETAGAR